MHNDISKQIIRIQDLSLGEVIIPSLHINVGEWIHLENLEDNEAEALTKILLLKDQSEKPFNYFGNSTDGITPKFKAQIRYKISYWPTGFDEITTDDFILLKKDFIDTSSSKNHVSTQLFLDHLTIGNSLDKSIENLMVALLMTSPQLLIIDHALDAYEDGILRQILSTLSKYSARTGMSIVNLTRNTEISKVFRGRRFALSNQQLLELMDY